jgi:hypothetical protein
MEGYPCLLSSGTPDSPVRHRTSLVACLVRDLLLLWASWRTGQSGAPADRWSSPRVAHRLRGRPLALAIIGSPNSPVHHRTVR